MIRCVLTADLHGELPGDIPDGELLLLGGDLCPGIVPAEQYAWLDGPFRAWLEPLAERFGAIIAIAGNHDFGFESGQYPRDLPWRYLADSGTEWEGLSVWGSPWQPPFGNWAFNLPEGDIHARLERAPARVDILITHGPPYLIGDRTLEGVHTGSTAVRGAIESRRPLLHCCGHIHEGYGLGRLDDTTCVNASLMTRRYQPVQPPIVVDLDPDARRIDPIRVG